MKKYYIIYPRILVWNLLVALIAGYIICDMIGLDDISSICFSGIYVLVILYVLLELERNVFQKKELILFLMILFIAIVNVFLGVDIISFDYFKKLILFLITLIMMILSLKYIPDRRTEKYYGAIFQILFVVIVYKSFIDIEYYGSTKLLSLGLNNSNIAGMWIFLVFGGILWRYQLVEKRFEKFIFALELMILAYSCILTGCRSAFISLFGVVVLFLCFNKTKKFDKVCILCSTFFPILFPFVYLGLYNIGFDIKLFGTKSLYSGRQDLWLNALKLLQEHPFRGVYYEISEGTGQSQMHNIFIDVISSYGIIVVILTWCLLMIILFRLKNSVETRAQHIVFYVFSLIVVGGTFEAALFSGGSGIGIWSCIFLVMIKYRNNCIR